MPPSHSPGSTTFRNARRFKRSRYPSWWCLIFIVMSLFGDWRLAWPDRLPHPRPARRGEPPFPPTDARGSYSRQTAGVTAQSPASRPAASPFPGRLARGAVRMNGLTRMSCGAAGTRDRPPHRFQTSRACRRWCGNRCGPNSPAKTGSSPLRWRGRARGRANMRTRERPDLVDQRGVDPPLSAGAHAQAAARGQGRLECALQEPGVLRHEIRASPGHPDLAAQPAAGRTRAQCPAPRAPKLASLAGSGWLLGCGGREGIARLVIGIRAPRGLRAGAWRLGKAGQPGKLTQPFASAVSFRCCLFPPVEAPATSPPASRRRT